MKAEQLRCYVLTGLCSAADTCGIAKRSASVYFPAPSAQEYATHRGRYHQWLSGTPAGASGAAQGSCMKLRMVRSSFIVSATLPQHAPQKSHGGAPPGQLVLRVAVQRARLPGALQLCQRCIGVPHKAHRHLMHTGKAISSLEM